MMSFGIPGVIFILLHRFCLFAFKNSLHTRRKLLSLNISRTFHKRELQKMKVVIPLWGQKVPFPTPQDQCEVSDHDIR